MLMSWYLSLTPHVDYFDKVDGKLGQAIKSGVEKRLK